jgi:hypothetical protein
LSIRKSLLRIFVPTVTLCLSSFISLYAQTTDKAHIPKQGSAERQAILDALRAGEKVTFKVHHLKVHAGWAWIDVTPLGEDKRPVAEGGPSLLHYEDGGWKVLDLSKVPEDPKDPMGREDASPGFVKNLIKMYPGVPRDIFPKPSH